MINLLQGDCLEKLKELADNSVDSIVSDPPAGIAFMGKSWDSDKGGRDSWIKWMQEVATECNRVLKHGGHAFVWAIPRTSHWTATAWENAGFEIRDVVAHIFGSGFPKSLSIGKKIDQMQGNRRAVVGREQKAKPTFHSQNVGGEITEIDNIELTKGSSEWEGWGSSLKPAREDWLLLRKPLEKGLNIAENCLKWDVGGLNIDASRVGTEIISIHNAPKGTFAGGKPDRGSDTESYRESVGRFPANLILGADENGVHKEVKACFPESKTGNVNPYISKSDGFLLGCNGDRTGTFTGDSGNASRFFKSIIYQAKASKSDRNEGCEGIMEVGGKANEITVRGNTNPVCLLCNKPQYDRGRGICNCDQPNWRECINKQQSNNHPTVKPTALMQYLITMITPKGGIVLDPFMGSGSTGKACVRDGFSFIGIEKEAEYFEIAKARINNEEKLKQLRLF